MVVMYSNNALLLLTIVFFFAPQLEKPEAVQGLCKQQKDL